MIKTILFSLTVTTLLSAIIGALIWLVFGVDPVRCFLATFLIQLVGSYIYRSFLQTLERNNIRSEETKRIEMYTQQGVDANCAYCNAQNFIPVRMDDDNSFTCDACGKTNAVYIDVTVAQKTDIIDKQNLSVSSYIKEKIDATERLQQG